VSDGRWARIRIAGVPAGMEVDALVIGNFAVHPNASGWREYTVTHIPTGFRVLDNKHASLAIESAWVLDDITRTWPEHPTVREGPVLQAFTKQLKPYVREIERCLLT